ncbi:MAG: dienelactone hydrolase family protein, partial [Gemmatimonadaceae bacterium]
VRTNQRFPLILMLHGSGAIGDDNTAQLGALAMSWADSAVRREFPAYVVVPQFSERSAYYEVDSTDGLPRSRSGSQLRAALDLVESLLRVEAIDTSRIYVMGFSMGASAVWQVLLLRPHTFAGAIAFAGIPPERATASLLMHENIFVLHGDADTENPPQADWAMLAALRRSGGTSALHKEFPGLGHEVPSSFVADISWRRWLFSQKLKLR